MQSNRKTTLAVNPGTRYLGIAVVRDSTLIDWGVLVITGQSPEAKMKSAKALISRLIARYQPSLLVTKKLHPSRRSASLLQVSRGIQGIANAKGLEIRHYSIDETEAFFAPDSKINKRQMAELVCHLHTALRHELRKEQNNLNPYHIRMFEAVALATMVEAKTKRAADCTLMAD